MGIPLTKDYKILTLDNLPPPPLPSALAQVSSSRLSTIASLGLPAGPPGLIWIHLQPVTPRSAAAGAENAETGAHAQTYSHESTSAHTGAQGPDDARANKVGIMMDECDGWWISATVWLQQSGCVCMSAVAACSVHTVCSREIVLHVLALSLSSAPLSAERLVHAVVPKRNLRGLYSSYRSKTNVTRIKKDAIIACSAMHLFSGKIS